jgi:hypothetical protein
MKTKKTTFFGVTTKHFSLFRRLLNKYALLFARLVRYCHFPALLDKHGDVTNAHRKQRLPSKMSSSKYGSLTPLELFKNIIMTNDTFHNPAN